AGREEKEEERADPFHRPAARHPAPPDSRRRVPVRQLLAGRSGPGAADQRRLLQRGGATAAAPSASSAAAGGEAAAEGGDAEGGADHPADRAGAAGRGA